MSYSRITVLGIVTGCGALLLSACSSGAGKNTKYGAVSSSSECKVVAHDAIRGLLKDPSSAEFRNEVLCTQGRATPDPQTGQKLAYGYLQTGEVNAKNGYGGYVGFQTYAVLIRNRKVVGKCIDTDTSFCSLDYQPKKNYAPASTQ